MSVEKKIKQLLDRASGAQQLSEATIEEASETAIAADGKVTVNTTKDTSKAGAKSGDSEAQPMQGSSKKADMEEVSDATGKNSAAAKMSKETPPAMKGDAKSAKVQAMEETEEEGEAISEEETSADIKAQLSSIFGEELSEDFRTKATSIFEAAVIARVNSEMEKVSSKLEEQTAAQLQEFKEALVEKVDGYLNYVVEQWMEENTLAVESGLRTEIAEDFINGMKTLFKEHYIEVPEEKYNVIDDLQATADEYKSKLDESINTNVQLTQELNSLKREHVMEELTKDLAATEAEKLKKLVEGVDFETEDLYRDKVAVIKENYFPKAAKPSPEKVLIEESGTNPTAFADNSMMSKYVSALSRTVKSR